MQWRKRWNDDTLLGRRDTSIRRALFGEFKHIHYASREGNGAASSRPTTIEQRTQVSLRRPATRRET
jgi:hypothetical protein